MNHHSEFCVFAHFSGKNILILLALGGSDESTSMCFAGSVAAESITVDLEKIIPPVTHTDNSCGFDMKFLAITRL